LFDADGFKTAIEKAFEMMREPDVPRNFRVPT
jgi:hypothetical protein